MIDSSIIEKNQKLRAITEQRGATEDEAIAAEQRMFSLLANYNLARLYPFEMARKYNNRGKLSIHNVFKLSSLDW